MNQEYVNLKQQMKVDIETKKANAGAALTKCLYKAITEGMAAAEEVANEYAKGSVKVVDEGFMTKPEKDRIVKIKEKLLSETKDVIVSVLTVNYVPPKKVNQFIEDMLLDWGKVIKQLKAGGLQQVERWLSSEEHKVLYTPIRFDTIIVSRAAPCLRALVAAEANVLQFYLDDVLGGATNESN